jgi:hypothetical protein
MDSLMGFTRMNIHKISKTLDSNKQVAPTSLIERVISVTDNGQKVKCTIADNVATITEAGYSEGDTVDMWLSCTRSRENGSICEQVIVAADETKYQDWLDSL